jgi:hypothetical protein
MALHLLYHLIHALNLFALVIFQIGSHNVPPRADSDQDLLPEINICVPPGLVCLLRWGLAHILPGLTSNPDPSYLFLNSCDYSCHHCACLIIVVTTVPALVQKKFFGSTGVLNSGLYVC